MAHPLKLERKGDFPDGAGVKIAIIDQNAREESSKYHKTLLTSSGRLKINTVDPTKEENQEIIANGNKKFISNHALQCTAVAVGEAVKDDKYTFPGGIAPKASATLYLVNFSNKRSIILALKEVKKKNFDVLLMTFESQNHCDYKDEVQEILTTTSTVVVVAAGNYDDPNISYPAKLVAERDFCDHKFISVGYLNYNNTKAEYSPENKKYVMIYQTGEFLVPHSNSNNTALKFEKSSTYSTAAVAGIICLLIQSHKKHNIGSLCKEELISLLKNVVKNNANTGIIEAGTYNEECLRRAFNEKEFFQTGCKVNYSKLCQNGNEIASYFLE